MALVNDNPLGGLIEREKQAHEGWSYRTIAARTPGRLSKSDVSDFVNQKSRFIRPDKLIALAEALEVPLPEVVQAALATIGLPAPAGRSVEDALAADGTLPELAKRRLLRALHDERVQAAEPPVGKAARTRQPDDDQRLE